MTNQVDEMVIASVIMGQEYGGETNLYYNDQPLTAQSIAYLISDSIKTGQKILILDNHEIELDKVWAVKDWITEELIVINEDNEPLSIDEKIPNMTVKQLCDTVTDVLDWIRCAESKEEENHLIQLHDRLLDNIKDRYYELASSR